MKVENKMKVAVVTGAAGFVGSNLVDDLLRRGTSVIGIDNLSTGRIKFLHKAMENTNFTFLEKDLFLDNNFEEIFKGSDTVFHLAANADVRFGPEHPVKDFEQNTFVYILFYTQFPLEQVYKPIFLANYIQKDCCLIFYIYQYLSYYCSCLY